MDWKARKESERQRLEDEQYAKAIKEAPFQPDISVTQDRHALNEPSIFDIGSHQFEPGDMGSYATRKLQKQQSLNQPYKTAQTDRSGRSTNSAMRAQNLEM